VSCFNKFSVPSALQHHEKSCLLNKPVLETVEKGSIKFKNFHYQQFQDYIAFLDFESVLPPESKLCADCNSLRCKCDKSFTEIVSHQEPIAYCFIILNKNNEIIHNKSYAGEDAADHFINHLLDIHEDWVVDLFNESKKWKFQITNKSHLTARSGVIFAINIFGIVSSVVIMTTSQENIWVPLASHAIC